MFQGRVLRVNVANVKKGDYKKMGVCLLDGIMRSSPCPHLQGREILGQKVGGGEQHSVLERSLSKQRHRHEGDLGEARRENERHPRCGVWKHGCASRSGGNRGVIEVLEVLYSFIFLLNSRLLRVESRFSEAIKSFW